MAQLFAKKKIKPAQVAYHFLRDQNNVSNSALITIWNHDLNIALDPKTFASLFRKINQISSSTKLRFLQYKILTKTLITNVHASKWDNTITSNCTFCNTVAETTLHLFFECACVRKLWTALSKWFKYFYEINVTFTAELCLLNNFAKRNSALINIIVLITKFFIYRCKSQKCLPKFTLLVKEISKVKNIEFFIASKNDKLYKFARRWDDFEIFE